MSQYAAPGAPASGMPYPVTGGPGYQPAPVRPRPAWMAARSTLEWVATGVAGCGLLIAVISLALPWEFHATHGEYGYVLWTNAQGSGGLTYLLGLLLLIGALVGLQFAPRRFNIPLRVSSGVLVLLLLGLLTGVVVSLVMEEGGRSAEDEVSWGLILAFVAVFVFGIAAVLSHPLPAGQQPDQPQLAHPGPEAYAGGVAPHPGEAYPYQGTMPHGHA